jgi:hypothetical protein
MLAVPLLMGIVVGQPKPWHLLLATTAVTGYLASAAVQAWRRVRERAPLVLPMRVYLVALAVQGAVLAVAFPLLAASVVVLAPTGLVVAAEAKPGTCRDLANSLIQVAQALVLVPAAALVGGVTDPARLAVATAIAAVYLFGTVLVVRSVLRERGNTRFAAGSAVFHAVGTVVAALALPVVWALLGAALTLRAVLLPVAVGHRARVGRPLRPVHVGVVEAVASVAVVLVSFLALP